MTSIPFDITANAQFSPVIDLFKNNFENDLELGAQFFALQNGEVLVDLKGGWADRSKSHPVTDKTLFSIFSSGKAVAAIIMAHLVDQDKIGYNQLVSSFWPEFSANGKADLTVAELLSHQSGLTGITAPDWTGRDWYDWEKTTQTLANQTPIFTPRTASGYSPQSYGFLAGEMARRVDSFGRSLGAILRQDICEPHDLDIWIGLPESEHIRCADMMKPRRLANLGEHNAATKAAFLSKGAAPARNDLTAWREAEFAGSNCHATAESLARLMAVLIDGKINAEQFLAQDTLIAVSKPRISGPDLVLPFDVTFCAGLMHNAPNFIYGPNPETLGHSGWGGSCVFADPDTGISGAYVMSRQDNSLMGDPRPVGLINALYAAL